MLRTLVLISLFAASNIWAAEETHLSLSQSPQAWLKGNVTFAAGGAGGGFALGGDFTVKHKGDKDGTFALRIGPQFGATFAGGAFVTLDFDAVIRPTFTFKLPRGHLSVYGQLPIGFTLGVRGTAVGPGLNFGLLPGVQYFFIDNFSVFTEFGFVFHGYGLPGGFASVPAGAFNVGFAYAF